ncbi:hypothetical protein [Halosegnis marinus]|uniref:hypothetical protein n=1 Tax=Halosegnis marinus TaxID=3034023 RepID=UPI00361484F3
MYRRLLVAVLVVLAGCGAAVPGGGEQTPSETATAAPVPTTTPAPTPDPVVYPPGLADDGVNATALAAATRASLSGTEFALQYDRREARPEPSLGAVYVGPRVQVRAGAPDRYVVNRSLVTERGGGLSIETFRNATYVNGSRATTLTRNGTETSAAGPDAEGFRAGSRGRSSPAIWPWRRPRSPCSRTGRRSYRGRAAGRRTPRTTP